MKKKIKISNLIIPLLFFISIILNIYAIYGEQIKTWFESMFKNDKNIEKKNDKNDKNKDIIPKTISNKSSEARHVR